MRARAHGSGAAGYAVAMAEDSTSASSLESPPERRRGPGRPFQPGQSGNPGGMPRGIAGRIMRARRLALRHAPKAIATLAALLDDPEASVRQAAAESLLDRAGLKPFSLEPERHEVAVAAVDVEGLRESLAQRFLALTATRAPVLDVGAVHLDSPADSQAPSTVQKGTSEASVDAGSRKDGTA